MRGRPLSRFLFMRYGFFGGTFNPVHLGHLALANEAIESLQLDHLWWLPANPWQKDAADLMPIDDRLEMLKRAIAEQTKMSIDTRELDRHTPSYSIDTVKELAQLYPKDDRFYLIGSDQWENFHTWKNWQDIFDYVTIVVFSRNGQHNVPATEVSRFLSQHVIEVKMLTMPALDIESSQIRKMLAQQPCNYSLLKNKLPPNVLNYLQAKELRKD